MGPGALWKNDFCGAQGDFCAAGVGCVGRGLQWEQARCGSRPAVGQRLAEQPLPSLPRRPPSWPWSSMEASSLGLTPEPPPGERRGPWCHQCPHGGVQDRVMALSLLSRCHHDVTGKPPPKLWVWSQMSPGISVTPNRHFPSPKSSKNPLFMWSNSCRNILRLKFVLLVSQALDFSPRIPFFLAKSFFLFLGGVFKSHRTIAQHGDKNWI